MFYQLPDGTEDYLEIDESTTIESVSKIICEKYNFEIEKTSLFTDGTMSEVLEYMPEEDYKVYVGINSSFGNDLAIRDEIKDKVKDLVRNELGWEGDIPEGDLSDLLDSVNRLRLVVAVEDYWQICFQPEDDTEVKSIDDIVFVIERILLENK